MSDERLIKGISIATVIVFGFVALMVFLSSCSPTKRMGAIAAKHPDKAREVCVQMFPPEIKTVTDTRYIHGTPTITTDTVYGNCDTVIKFVNGKPIQVIRKVAVPCPPSYTRIDTVVKTETTTIENTAKIDVLNKEVAECKADADKARNGRNTWRYIALAALAVLIGATALKLFFGKGKAIKNIVS